MGGWAPYTSLAGMLRSSTNTTQRLPMGGPYTPFLRLSRRLSTCSQQQHTHVLSAEIVGLLLHGRRVPLPVIGHQQIEDLQVPITPAQQPSACGCQCLCGCHTAADVSPLQLGNEHVPRRMPTCSCTMFEVVRADRVMLSGTHTS